MSTTNGALRELLRQAENFLDDIWDGRNNRLQANLNDSYVANSIQTALSSLRAAINLTDRAVTGAKPRGMTLALHKPMAHPGPGGADSIPDPYYVVREVLNNVQYDVGMRVDMAQAALLAEDPDWTIRFVQ